MKTENEYSTLFVESCSCKTEVNTFVQNLSKSYWTDLTSHLHVYFSNEDRQKITLKAAEMFCNNLKSKSPEESWKEVIRSFVNNNHWGFSTLQKKPKIKQTEEQKIFWTLFRYIWIFIQATLVVKVAIYFFGIKAAEDPDRTSVLWVWLFFSFSVASGVFFIWRNRNSKD